MGVRIPRIDFEFLKQLATESILWQHAFYGKSNQILRSFVSESRAVVVVRPPVNPLWR